MIVYGSKATLIGKETLVEKCPNCGKINSVDIHVFQKYAHIFWIPFFPIGKTGVSECQHCKQVLKVKEMPDSIRTTYENIKAQSKAPVWTFSGIALVAILITVAVISGKQKDARNTKLILSPQRGDIYEIKTGGNYTLYKVSDVVGDKVYLLYNLYETNQTSGLPDLKKKGFAEDAQPFLKSEIKALFDKGEIIDIDR